MRNAFYTQHLDRVQKSAEFVASDHCVALTECLNYLSHQQPGAIMPQEIFTSKSVVLYDSLPEENRRDFLPFQATILNVDQTAPGQARIDYEFFRGGAHYKAIVAFENGRWRIDLWATIELYRHP